MLGTTKRGWGHIEHMYTLYFNVQCADMILNKGADMTEILTILYLFLHCRMKQFDTEGCIEWERNSSRPKLWGNELVLATCAKSLQSYCSKKKFASLYITEHLKLSIQL